MDLAKLGISIDPARAVQGSNRAKQALKEVGQEAQTSLKKVDDAADRSGKSVQRMADTNKRSFANMTSGMIGFLDSLGLMNTGFGAFVRRSDSIVRSGAQLSNNFSSVGKSASGAASGVAEVGTAAAGSTRLLAGLGGSAAVAGVALGAFLAIVLALSLALGGLALAIKGVITGVPLAAKFEADTVAIETLIGSTTKAQKLMKDLADLGAKTPLETPELMGAARSLLAFGESTESVVGTLRRVGDVALGVQAPIGEIATLYGKARVQGTLFAEDINQLTNRGIPVLELFAQQLNVGVDRVKKMGSEGKITFPMLEKAFVSLTSEGGKFFNMMERQSQTFNGKVSTLTDNWNAMLRDMAAPVAESLKPILDDLIKLVENMTPYAVSFGNALAAGIQTLYMAIQDGKLSELLKLALMAGIEQAAANFLIMFQLAWMGFAKLFVSVLEGAITMLANFFVSAFVAVINFITKLIIGDWKGAFGEVGNFFQGLFSDSGGGIISNIGATITNTLGNAFERVVNDFVQGFYKAWQAVDKMIQAGRAELNLAPTGLGPVAPKPLDFFTPSPIEWKDLTKAANNVVGTTNRDAMQKFVDESVAGFKKEFPGMAAIENPATKVDLPKSGSDGKKGKEKDLPKAEVVREPLKDLANEWTDLGAQMIEVAIGVSQSIADNMTDAITGLIDGTKDAKTAFSDMATSIIRDIMRMVVQMYVQLAVGTALKALGYGGAGTGASMHTGGVVGGRTTTYGGVPTYHSGGVTSAEQMTKTQRGETILTRRRAAELEQALAAKQVSSRKDNASGSGTTIINVTDRNEILDVITSNPDAVLNSIGRRQPALRKLANSKERP